MAACGQPRRHGTPPSPPPCPAVVPTVVISTVDPPVESGCDCAITIPFICQERGAYLRQAIWRANVKHQKAFGGITENVLGLLQVKALGPFADAPRGCVPIMTAIGIVVKYVVLW